MIAMIPPRLSPWRRARRARLGSLAALALLVACNAAPPLGLIPPRVDVADVSIRDVGFTELRFVVTVRADNPNEIDLPLSGLTFDLDLLGRPFATGIAAEPRLTLPARTVREVPIDFTVPTTRLVDLVGAAATGGLSNLSYRLRGRAGWGWSGFPISFEKSGNLDVLRRIREVLGPLVR